MPYKCDDKEFRLQLQVRNNRLIKAREREGLSCPKMAEKMGVSYGLLVGYESLKVSPRSRARGNSHGKWKSSAVKIATYFGSVPEYFWSEEVQAVEKPRAVRELSVDEAKQLNAYQPAELPAPIDVVERHELQTAIHALVQLLDDENPKVAFVLRRRFGLDGDPCTLTELGEEMGLSHEQVRKYEIRALKKLRHPSRSQCLKPFVAG